MVRAGWAVIEPDPAGLDEGLHLVGDLCGDREGGLRGFRRPAKIDRLLGCLLYTSDAADERSSVDFGGRRSIKKKQKTKETTL